MDWSEQRARVDEAAQSAWVASWPGWDTVPSPRGFWSDGWNALHGETGGGFPDSDPADSPEVPARFWDTEDNGWSRGWT